MGKDEERNSHLNGGDGALSMPTCKPLGEREGQAQGVTQRQRTPGGALGPPPQLQSYVGGWALTSFMSTRCA